jgi:hypothetical protein
VYAKTRGEISGEFLLARLDQDALGFHIRALYAWGLDARWIRFSLVPHVCGARSFPPGGSSSGLIGSVLGFAADGESGFTSRGYLV